MVESHVISVTPAKHADEHRTGGTDPLTGAVGINSLMVDHCRGLVPVCDNGWTTPISDLTNITDGDMNTETTDGLSSTASDVEITKIDLGSIKNIDLVVGVGCIYGFSTGTDAYLYLETSPDDATWTILGSRLEHNITSWKCGGINGSPPDKIRYIRMRSINNPHNQPGKYKLRAIKAFGR